MLTDSQVRALKPRESLYRISDGGGLYIEVSPAGTRTWRIVYRFEGNQRSHTLGTFPEMKVAVARFEREAIRAALRAGEDPREATGSAPSKRAKPTRPPRPKKPIDTEPGSWADVANRYLRKRHLEGAAPRTMAKLHRQIGVTVEALGARPARDLTARDILAVLRPIADDGHVETAHEVRTRFSQVFRFAIAEGSADRDPAAATIDAIVKRRRGGFAGITNPKEVGELLKAIKSDRKCEPQVRAGLLLSAYLFPRNTELRGMRWDEIDWTRAMWEVPGLRMKMGRDHLIPLPTQAIAVLKDIRRWTGRSPLVLPAPRDPQRMLSDNTFNLALRRLGFGNDRHVHHGFRTTASTNLNEMGWNRDWIERQLAHVESNRVRSSYNKAEYIDQRAEMMQAYADWLDAQ